MDTPRKEKKTERMGFTMTKRDRKRIVGLAMMSGMTLTDYMVYRCLQPELKVEGVPYNE